VRVVIEFVMQNCVTEMEKYSS